MLFFLYGPDTYRSWQKLQEMAARYKKIHKSGLNLLFLDLENEQFDDFKNKLRSSSMFREKKLFILTQAFSNKQFQENLLDMFGHPTSNRQNIIVFYEKGVPDKRSRFFRFLKTKAKCQEFNLLTPGRLSRWTEKEISRLGAKIAPSALNKLVGYIGPDLWRMQNEIKKLAAYQTAEPGLHTFEITAQDVELLVKPKIETDIFKTIEAMSGKNKKLALCLLQEHLKKGDSALYLLAMLAYQFRNLLSICDLLRRGTAYHLLAKKAGLHPFVVKKTHQQAKNFNLPKLKKIYQKLFNIDLQVKTGKIDPEMALDLLISDL